MTPFFKRASAGAIALLFAAAAFDVSGARAQTVYPTAEGTTATSCGAGAIVSCGTEVIMKCETHIEVNFNILARGGGFKITTTKCQAAGSRTLFKDQEGTVTCSTNGGSRGSGLSGTRGSGDDDGDFCF